MTVHRDTKTATVTSEEGLGKSTEAGLNFIEQIVEEDLRTDRYAGRVVTRFPPEPNGYLHIGHAKSICLNFGLADDYKGVCHLRFDDTNPETEDEEYVASIQHDVRWLGFEWDDKLFFASDYYEQLYKYAELLIEKGKAYVDSSTEEEIRRDRGTVTEPGTFSPYRNRPVAENLDLFRRMRAGEFPDGAHVLRAKIDMASNNMKMRDPLLYRIKHAHHYRSGDEWCIYPMYDFAHPLSDAIEGITHSICTLEFDNNRELYDWVVDHTRQPPRPHQYEFARLNLDYTIMSKRKLLQLVMEGHVEGWDDPRMPTIAGLRRRGVTPEAIRTFCDLIGVAKADNRVDMSLLEYAIRDDLNYRAPRVMCVTRPLKVVLTDYPEGKVEWMEAAYWPHDIPKEGARKVPFSRELYIERDDFMEDPPRKFFRLSPGQEVRLRYGYIIKCEEVIKDANGEVIEVRCSHDPKSRSGSKDAGRRVKGTIHWVSAAEAIPVELRLYDRLFSVPNPDAVEEGKTFKDYLNPHSADVIEEALIEPSMAGTSPAKHFQFERQGYFFSDPVDATPEKLVFNRVVTLRDTWSKLSGAEKPAEKPLPKKKTESVESKQPEVSRTEARDRVRADNPDLAARYRRYQEELGVQGDEADILTGGEDVANVFEAALAAHHSPTAVANWIIHELPALLKGRGLSDLPAGGEGIGELVALIEDHTISGTIAKKVFAEMLDTGKAPEAIVEEKGLRQIKDADALEPMVDKLIMQFPDKVKAYRDGKKGLIGFFVGQVMRETQGKANPQLVKSLLEARLG